MKFIKLKIKEKIVVITNLCDTKSFQYKKIWKIFRSKYLGIKDEPLIVYAGSFGKINNAAYLVDIAAESKKLNKEIKFLMAGDGYQKNLILNKSKKLNLLNKIFSLIFIKKRLANPIIFRNNSNVTYL